MSDPVVLLSTGDVVGPAGGVTDNSMVLFSGTSGKLIKGNNAVVTAAGLALLDDVNAAAQRTTLGLGTAATATLTTSATDTTAGRVMKFGDFGLGAALNLSGQDLNDTDLGTGMYYCVSPVNGPGANGHLWQHRRSSVVIAQYYVTANNTDPKTYFRSMNGTWSVWKELWHSGNQIDLGTTATAAKTVLGLEDVTNTSDANKPVSTAQQTALNLKANLASPTFTGTPLAPTNASPGNKSTQIATTAFVQSVVNGLVTKAVTGGTVTLTADEASNSTIGLSGTLTSNLILEIPVGYDRIFSVSNSTTGAFTVVVKVVGKAPTVAVAQGKRNLIVTSTAGAYDAINDFDAIALTGVSTAVTAALGNSTTQIATTAFVNAEIANDAPTKTGGGASGSWAISVTGSSGSCTGNAASASTSTTLTGLTPTVTELNFVNGVTSAIQTQLDTKAPLASPALTGTPTAPTAAAGTNTTQLANTAFVKAAVAASPGLGVGQTWQDVTGSRTSGVAYTNSTGRPIQVTVNVNDSGGGAWNFVLNGTTLSWDDMGGSTDFASFVIPNGNTYQVNRGAHTIAKWMELR